MEKNSVNYKYLVRSPRDIDWGITVDTVGSEPIPPNYPVYPPRTGHPDAFYFTPSRGRVLDSYQLLYITHGKGYFYTSPDTFIEIKEGDILILQPHVWHSYFPDKKTGWQEYWIGFQGINMDSRFQNNFFAKDQIVYHIGVQDSIVKLYEQAIQVVHGRRIGGAGHRGRQRFPALLKAPHDSVPAAFFHRSEIVLSGCQLLQPCRRPAPWDVYGPAGLVTPELDVFRGIDHRPVASVLIGLAVGVKGPVFLLQKGYGGLCVRHPQEQGVNPQLAVQIAGPPAQLRVPLRVGDGKSGGRFLICTQNSGHIKN